MKVKSGISKEVQRLLFSYQSLIFIAVILVFASLSFYFTYQDKLEWIQVFSEPREDIDISRVKENINSFVGFKFLSDYYFGDFSQLANTFILVFIGLFLSPILSKFLNTGFGNFVLARESYSYLLKVELISNVIYINILYLLSNLIVIFIGFGLGGFNGSYQYGKFSLSEFHQVAVVLLNLLIISIFISLITITTISMNIFSNNEYILAMLPLSLYLIFPLFISSTLGNIFRPVAKMINPFIIWDFQNVIHDHLTFTVVDGNPFISATFPYIVMVVLSTFIAGILVYKNAQKYKEEYL